MKQKNLGTYPQFILHHDRSRLPVGYISLLSTPVANTGARLPRHPNRVSSPLRLSPLRLSPNCAPGYHSLLYPIATRPSPQSRGRATGDGAKLVPFLQWKPDFATLRVSLIGSSRHQGYGKVPGLGIHVRDKELRLVSSATIPLRNAQSLHASHTS
ncbi:hypothetical protein M011DRAFT_248971 [Sporormia fimetaria CBS 119925]|uniref:Uncharacterized protein n=1 Tax=Sporormia fimetaria CBS 119925 TaxID=1340428 RepID=A0A6A6UXJ8_9PLEO|nr:hypothetical protein M011DRAFT_248971 [Sporormia fimetaria CBS 119925]